jgi:hypothetical protein
MVHGDRRGQSQIAERERGRRRVAKKKKRRDVISRAHAGPQAFIPLAHARRKGERPRPSPFLYSPPSPPPFSFILFDLHPLQHKASSLLLKLFILPNTS